MIEHSPLITVLMPAYNAGEYIAEAIESVLQQSFTDFEFLIINDGSTDNTAEIIALYTDPRIRVIHQENMGLVKTLNKGLQMARGTWIARFDADDVCYEKRLRTQVSFINENRGYVAIGSEADYMTEDGEYIFTYRFEYYKNEEIQLAPVYVCYFIHSSVMFLKDAVIKAGGYDAGAITFEDHLLWRKLRTYGKMANIPEPLIKVRFNAASATIDEKWRGPTFKEIKYKSIEHGYVLAEDAETLKRILAEQNLKEYKDAAYNSMLGKKFLWDQYMPVRARSHLKKAITAQPTKTEPYLLYLLSFLPKKAIWYIYKRFKN